MIHHKPLRYDAKKYHWIVLCFAFIKTALQRVCFGVFFPFLVTASAKGEEKKGKEKKHKAGLKSSWLPDFSLSPCQQREQREFSKQFVLG